MEQARYFVAHPTSSYIQLADNITQPFNEYLHLFIRFGFMGLVLLSAIAWMTYQKMRTCATRLKQAAWASLCAGAVCACFSYPCHYPAIWVLLILSLSNIYTPTVSQGHAATRYKAFSVLAIAFCVLSLSIIQARYEQQRISLEERAANGEDSASLQDSYNLLYDRSYFRIHPAFLYNYAMCTECSKASIEGKECPHALFSERNPEISDSFANYQTQAYQPVVYTPCCHTTWQQGHCKPHLPFCQNVKRPPSKRPAFAPKYKLVSKTGLLGRFAKYTLQPVGQKLHQ